MGMAFPSVATVFLYGVVLCSVFLYIFSLFNLFSALALALCILRSSSQSSANGLSVSDQIHTFCDPSFGVVYELIFSPSIPALTSRIFTNIFWLCLYCSSLPLFRNVYVSVIVSSIFASWLYDMAFCVSCIFLWNPSNLVSSNVVKLFNNYPAKCTWDWIASWILESIEAYLLNDD